MKHWAIWYGGHLKFPNMRYQETEMMVINTGMFLALRDLQGLVKNFKNSQLLKMNIMATYDYEIPKLGNNGDGTFTYRWDIKAVEVSSNSTENGEVQETVTKWECKEVIIYSTVSKDSIIAAVLSLLWPSDVESKLQNDYNAAKAGTMDSSCIDRYVSFLKERKQIKFQINSDYRDIYGIERTLKDAINEKLSEIEEYDSGIDINSFLVNDSPCWITAEQRAVYRTSVESAEMLGEQTIEMALAGLFITLPVQAAKGMLAEVQRYADKSSIQTAKHKQAVLALTTIEEVDAYDYTVNYDSKPTYTINL
jgi:hypothetical protein